MKTHARSWSTLFPAFLGLIILVLTTGVAAGQSAAGASASEVQPKWVKNLPNASCPWSSTDTNCHYASPVLADLTNDGRPDIVTATNNGYVVAFRSDGRQLWSVDTGPYFGMSGGQQQIASSPAVADIDGDGLPEIVVGAGTTNPAECTQGGLIVLEHDGRVKSGWPYLTEDFAVPPAGCRDSVFSTPALGDLDKDGDLEIVFGSFDKRIYAMHHDGRMVAGFPPNSALYDRFGWPILRGRMADTVWSSPALGDLDGDGFLDIVIGTDEGNFESLEPDDISNWKCPYTPPVQVGYCGGAIYAFDRFGKVLPGFPRYEFEIFQSTPTLYDVNRDGRLEIFVGTGSFYNENSPDHPTEGFRVFGMDNRGRDLPGWEGGKVVGGTVPASPVVGDITGDGRPEIVVAARDKKLYAWHDNGQPVSGFPMVPRTHFGQTIDNYDIPTSFILADFNGDGKMEILFSSAWEVVVVDGRGQQLTATSSRESRPFFYTNGTLWSNPAVGDLDGNGRLELIASNSQLTVWELANSTTKAEWPMFKRDAARTSAKITPVLTVSPPKISFMHEQGAPNNYNFALALRTGMDSFNWSASTSQQGAIFLPKSSGTADTVASVAVRVTVPANAGLGSQTLGTVNVTVKEDGTHVINSPASVQVKVQVVRELFHAYLPLTVGK